MPNIPIASSSGWDSQRLEEFCKRCSGAPPAWPHRSPAVWVLLDCLEAASSNYPGFERWIQSDLRPYIMVSAHQTAQGERNPLRGQSKSYGFHLLLLELSKPRRLVQLQAREMVRKLLGFWSLCHYLEEWTPAGNAVRKVRTIACNGNTKSDSLGTLERYLRQAHKRLLAAIETNPVHAAEFGLIGAKPAVALAATADSAWGNFNTDLRRHWNTQIQDASSNRVRSLPGKDALTHNVLHHAGQDLSARVRAGDCVVIASCLQTITRLPARLLKELPLQCNENAQRYLAHLDLVNGRYVFDLHMVVYLSEAPTEASADLFIKTSPGFISLPRFLWKALRVIAARKPEAQCLGDLMSFDLPNPRTTMVDSHGHRITQSRIQSTLPMLLLHKGAHRWPVAIATQCWWLVSKGRRAYSVCPQHRINELTTQMYEHLGWGSIDCRDDADQFIGSVLTPHPESLHKIADFLGSNLVGPDQVRTVEQLNQWAAYCTYLAAWFLALRARERYPIDWQAIAHARHVYVNDKDVHLEAPPPIPVIAQLHAVLATWNVVVAAFIANGESEETGKLQLFREIESRNHNGTYPLFSIDGIATIRPAGTDTWLRHLPAQLRPARNFGRHFWPWRLMERGVIQRQVDLLMRHQTTHLDPYGPKRLATFEDDAQKLRSAMEAEISELLGEDFMASPGEGENA